MESTVKERIGSHVPKLFGSVAALCAAASPPSADGEGVAERLAAVQADVRKALLLVGPQ